MWAVPRPHHQTVAECVVVKETIATFIIVIVSGTYTMQITV